MEHGKGFFFVSVRVGRDMRMGSGRRVRRKPLDGINRAVDVILKFPISLVRDKSFSESLTNIHPLNIYPKKSLEETLISSEKGH